MILSCEENMLRVVHKLNLHGRWNISLTEASAKLSRMLETIHEPDTDIITIEVFSTNTHDAAEFANAVFAYEQQISPFFCMLRRSLKPIRRRFSSSQSRSLRVRRLARMVMGLTDWKISWELWQASRL